MNEENETSAGGSARRDWAASILDSALGAPQDRSTLSEWAADRLRALILDGDLPPGMPLRPHHLAERLGVSVMPVREALRILAADELATISPRRGATVRSMAADDVEESFAIRGALEALAARVAVPNLTNGDMDRLRNMMERLRAASESDDLTTFLEHDRAFHALLSEASMRPQLAKRIMGLWDSLRRVYTLPKFIETTHMEVALASHEAILLACESGDPAAVERAVRMHTEEAARRIVPALRHRDTANRE